MDDNYHQHMFDENMALVEMPLIAPISSHYAHHRHNSYYPYNLTGGHHGGGSVQSMENVIIAMTTSNGDHIHKSRFLCHFKNPKKRTKQ